MPPHATEPEQLLQLAQRYRVNIPNEVLAAARNVPEGSELDRWLTHTLSTAALLSPDDYELWSRLSRRSDTEEKSRLAALDGIGGASFDSAITALNASSQQTTARIRTLASQKTLLGRSNSSSEGPLGTSNREQDQKMLSKCQNIRLSNDAKTANLADTIRATIATRDKEAKVHPAVVSERLNADDRIFEALERRAPPDSATVAIPEISTRTQQLARTLQTKRVSSLQDRLDRTYLTALKAQPMNSPSEADAADMIPDLRQDIQSLYTEIDDVVTMTIGHEHMNRLQDTMDRINMKQENHLSQILQDAHLRISQMADQLDSLASQIQRVQAHRIALSEASCHLDKLHLATTGTAAQVRPATPDEATSRIVDRIGLADNASSASSSAMSSLQALASLRQTLDSASLQRAQVLRLLQALEGATSTRSLDELDRRIKTTSRQFDEIVKKSA